MIFLNWSLALGLLGLLVPLVIHLFNRRRPKPLAWGAMRFLAASLAVRRRHLQLEDLLLLATRCLLVAAVALAMARPFVPDSARLAPAFLLALTLGAIVSAAAAVARWQAGPARRRLLLAAGLTLLAAAALALAERRLHLRRWFQTDASRDVAIVLDASLSMQLAMEGRSTFDRAVEEARLAIRTCRPGDTCTLILGGPAPYALTPQPGSDFAAVEKALADPECRPGAGSFEVPEAIGVAAAALAEGPNPDKTLVLITDGQAVGWDARAEARWRLVADRLQTFAAPPRLLLRRLPLPRAIANAGLAGIALSRTVIGIDRPVTLSVEIANTGTTPLQPAALEWQVDGAVLDRTPFHKEIPPGVTETLHCECRFTNAGPHVVHAALVVDDDLPADNAADRVVTVLDRLPILIVDGSPSARPLRRASGFLRLALAPPDRAAPAVGADSFLMEPTLTTLADFMTLTNLPRYRAIVLADVPRLPAAATARLADWVRQGGGLWIVPGPQADPAFFGAWQSPAGEPLSPAAWQARLAPTNAPLRLDPASLTHPALAGLREDSDAPSALVTAYWQLAADARDPDVRIGGRFENGDPFLVERQFGRGVILLSAISLDRRDSNLPTRQCFVPLVHELAYALAAPATIDLNVRPGEAFALDAQPARARNGSRAAEPVRVGLPSGREQPAAVVEAAGRTLVRFAATREAGLYRLHLPPTLEFAPGLVSNRTAGLPFAVAPQPGESVIEPLTETDLGTVRRFVPLLTVDTREALAAALSGAAPGRELWRLLALAALALVVAEVFLCRWIARRRQVAADPTSLPHLPVQDQQALRAHLQKIIATPAPAEPPIP